MGNNAELSGKYLGSITADFVVVSDILKDAAYQIKVRKISDYPIFVICRTSQPIGQMLIDQKEHQLSWNYYASFANEFVERGLIDADKIDFFIQNYKDTDEFCCLFVVDTEFTNFVFVPYPED